MSEIWDDLRTEHRGTIEQIVKLLQSHDLKVFITGKSTEARGYDTIEIVANSKYGSGPNDFEKSISEITEYLIRENPDSYKPSNTRSNPNFAIIYEYNLKNTTLEIYLKISFNPTA